MKNLLPWLGRRRAGIFAFGLGLFYFGFRIDAGSLGLLDIPRGVEWLKVLSGQGTGWSLSSAMEGALIAVNGQWDPGASLLLHALGEGFVFSLLGWFSVRCLVGTLRKGMQRFPLPAGFRPYALLIAGLLSIWAWQAWKPRSDSDLIYHPGKRAAALRTYLTTGDASQLGLAFGHDEALLALAKELLDAPRVASRLPPAVRAPLSLAPVRQSGFETCQASKVAKPDVGSGDFSAWTRAGTGSGAHFESREIESPFPLFRVRVNGLLGEGNRMVLLTRDGVEHEPLQPALEAKKRWRQLTLPNPGAPFRIVVRTEGIQPLSFSSPVELGRMGWLAGKLLPGASFFLWLGFGIALLGIWLVLRRPAEEGALEAAPAGVARIPFLPWIALALWLFLLGFHVDFYAGGSDSSGYMNIAKNLLDGRVILPLSKPDLPGLEELSPERCVPLGYIAHGQQTMVPTYPIGLPLMIAGLGLIMPLDWASGLCSLLHLAGMIWMTRLLARCAGLSEGWSWAAGWVAGMSPMAVFIGLQPMSDLPAAVWTLAVLVLAWKARERPLLALAAGAALGMTVLLRPTSVLLALPALVLLAGRPSVFARRLLLFGLGGLPMAAFLALYNHRLHGSPFLTGYGSVGGLFSTQSLGVTLQHYALWIPRLLSPLVLLAAAFPFIKRVPGLLRGALLLWILLLGGLYALYSCTQEAWWYHRFVLPIFPALVIASAAVLRSMTGRLESTAKGTGCLSAGIFVAVLCYLGWQGGELRWMETAEGNRNYKEAVCWVEQKDPQALVAGLQVSGALAYYTKLGFVDAREPADTLRVTEAARRGKRPLYAVVMEFEDDFVARPGAGSWQKVHTVAWIDIYRWRE